jgi:tRNA threonylcarbamoyladenosine biosynthesis protein TsaE
MKKPSRPKAAAVKKKPARRGPAPASFRSKSEKETREFAARLAKSFTGSEVVFLTGELGAGKTVFAKGVAAGLGVKDIGEVCSPTFTLMNIYQARVPIYRLGSSPEIRDLGFEDYIGDGVILVEWAEKIDFPISAIRVSIGVEADETRTIRVERRPLRP